MKFTIRDLFLVTMIVALAVGWAIDHRRNAGGATDAKFLAEFLAGQRHEPGEENNSADEADLAHYCELCRKYGVKDEYCGYLDDLDHGRLPNSSAPPQIRLSRDP